MSILIREGTIYLPLAADKIDYYLSENREALGWKLEDFLRRAKQQIEDDQKPCPPASA